MLRTMLLRPLDGMFRRRVCFGAPIPTPTYHMCRTLISESGKRSSPEDLFKDVRPLHTSTSKADKASALKMIPIDFDKVKSEFFKINMRDLKEAPLPAFWVGFVGLAPLAFPPLTSILIGYSPILSYIQLAYATALLSCVGGIKWGYVLKESRDAHTWENYGASIIPCLMATTAICLPPAASFLVVILGYLASFVIDLHSSRYPPWFIALRGVLTNISVFFLTITMFQSLIH